jgi:hypothetical protein
MEEKIVDFDSKHCHIFFPIFGHAIGFQESRHFSNLCQRKSYQKKADPFVGWPEQGDGDVQNL